MFDKDAAATISAMARDNNLEPAVILALAQVESGGRVTALVDGRSEPLIRFEGHYFDRRLSGERRSAARRAGLAAPQAGAIANPRSQAERWALLWRAAAIDRRAAFESVSWGVGQVMGAHWAWLGFASVDALVAEARSGLAGQVRLMLRYIDRAGLRDALARHDWPAVARGYNGPGYAASRYDAKLARAHRSYAAGGSDPGAGVLRQGARGAAVADLQILLSALGYRVSADGIFGPLTRRAVERFQRDRGLAVDGAAGPATAEALRRAQPLGFLAGRLRAWFVRLFTGIFDRG